MHQQAQKLNQHNGSNITHLAVDLCRFDCLSVHMEEPLEWRKHPTSALSCRKSPYLHLFVQRTDQEVSNKQSHSTSNYRLPSDPRNSHGFLRGSICHCCVLSRNFSCWWCWDQYSECYKELHLGMGRMGLDEWSLILLLCIWFILREQFDPWTVLESRDIEAASSFVDTLL